MHPRTITAAERFSVNDRWPKPPDEMPRVPPAEVPVVPERFPGPTREVPVEPNEIPGPDPTEVPEPGEDVHR
jgi:hypothetical protein